FSTALKSRAAFAEANCCGCAPPISLRALIALALRKEQGFVNHESDLGTGRATVDFGWGLQPEQLSPALLDLEETIDDLQGKLGVLALEPGIG
ncbi:MAG: hypothetical protein M3463_04445, partial [Verrucomicrobiota bacterium]|nr:hypothetical protein [Verrucomicrobiota bacterium]